MFRDMAVRCKNGEEGGLRAGNRGDEVGGARAAGEVRIRAQAVGEKEKRFPFPIPREVLLVGRNVLEMRQIVVVLEDALQFFPDCAPVRLDARVPRKFRRRKKLAIADERFAADQRLDSLKEAPAALENNVADPCVQAGDFIGSGSGRNPNSGAMRRATAKPFSGANRGGEYAGEAPRIRFRDRCERTKCGARRFEVS